jgi:hypothetical protein
MVVILPPDIAHALCVMANEQNTPLELLVWKALREKYNLPPGDKPDEWWLPRDEWERAFMSIGVNAGVSPPPEALASEGLYD